MASPGSDDEMFCPSCGERIRRTAKFCRHCGEPNTKHSDYPGGGDRGRPAPRDGRSTERMAPGEERPAGGTVPGEEPPTRRPAPDDERPAGPTASGGEQPAGRPASDEERTGEQRDNGSPEPWETDYARRVESRIDDGGEDEDGNGDGTPPQWRAYLPERTADDSTLRAVAVATGLGIGGTVLLTAITLWTITFGMVFGFSMISMAILGTLLGQYVGFAGLALWYLNRRGLDWDRMRGYLGVRMPSLKELGLVVGSWLVILALLIVIGLTLEIVTDLLGTGEPDEPEQALDDFIADNPSIVPAAILVMFLVVGPCEELLFRGVVQGRLRERLSAVPAIVIASALFAAVHVIALAGSLQAIMLGISVLFVTSLVIGAVYEYTGSVVVAALLHGFHNSMVILLLYVEATTDLEEGMLVLLSLF